ncbi:hypothetical protein BDA96_10G351600 [Sorghum bicolor]|uniref:Uncharacterized protein n=1 Tax=Sorghum bicolor TaxID=4558 RepID=A0A921Q6Q8_SORBI|nr:hypothetical protein BDA96_10G351600 [Sorghum bicolor]
MISCKKVTNSFGVSSKGRIISGLGTIQHAVFFSEGRQNKGLEVCQESSITMQM